MEEYKGEMIQYPLSKLNKMGLLISIKSSFKQKLVLILGGFVFLLCFFSAGIQYFYIESNIFDFIENTEAFGGLLQIITKFLCSIYYEKQYRHLIQLSKQFWNTEKCSKLIKKKVDNISQKIVIFQKMYFYLTFLLIPAIVATTFFGKKLPIGIWMMENEGIFYKLVFASWMVVLPFAIFFLTTFEGIFLGFCYEIKTQFMILSSRLENLNVSHIRSSEDFVVYNQQLRNNIRHHVFLIMFFKELQKAYSWCFIAQCFTIAPMVCTYMYVISESDRVLIMVRYGFTCIALIVQFAVYCVPGTFVVDEASIIADGIYNSDWFSKSFPQLRMPIVFLIQTSQQELKFTAGNLIAINIDTLLKVVKFSFSANAVLKSIKE